MKRASVTSSQLKEQYNQHQKQQEMLKANEHVATMEEELRKFRRDQLMQRQTLEKHLLIEVQYWYINSMRFEHSLVEHYVSLLHTRSKERLILI